MSQSDIQLRLYRAMLLVGACLSVISVIGNYISAFPFLSDIKWIVLFLISVFAYILSKHKKLTPHIMFGVFLFLIFILLPFAFVDSGGSSNNAIGYVFLLEIVITFLFGGWKRNFLAVALIAVFIAMHALEYFCPASIKVYSGRTQFVDRMIQIPILLLSSFLIILNFTKEYEKVNQKLSVLAKYDELTGLYNRRMFNVAIEEAFLRKNQSVYLALLDLNNFKKVNDKCGHSTGDKALKELSDLLQMTFGFDQHVVSRWGGDEFAVIYYGPVEELNQKLEHVTAAFRAYVSTYEETAGISISVVPFQNYATISQMFNEADKQLYQQKQNMRETDSIEKQS